MLTIVFFKNKKQFFLDFIWQQFGVSEFVFQVILLFLGEQRAFE